MVQGNGLSPVCERICFSKTLGFRQSRPQWAHMCFPMFFALTGLLPMMVEQFWDNTVKGFTIFRVRVCVEDFWRMVWGCGANTTDKPPLSMAKLVPDVSCNGKFWPPCWVIWYTGTPTPLISTACAVVLSFTVDALAVWKPEMVAVHVGHTTLDDKLETLDASISKSSNCVPVKTTKKCKCVILHWCKLSGPESSTISQFHLSLNSLIYSK